MNRIIIEDRFGHWTAWFEDTRHVAFGGDTPGTAVEHLWDNWIANQELIASRG